MNGNALLSIRNLSASYYAGHTGFLLRRKAKPILNSISLEIGRGEIFGLVGESGCGKTTLGKCILGIIDYEGDILINGRERKKNPSFRERREGAFDVQAVFQNPGASLNPAKTVGWIMEEPLRAHKLGSKAERLIEVDRMLDLVGLDSSYKKRRPDELSSGQKQRVSIASALILNPGLLIADEPVSALDVSVGAQILNLFRELNRKLELSMLFISHNLDLVSYLCGRVAVMRNGKIEEISG